MSLRPILRSLTVRGCGIRLYASGSRAAFLRAVYAAGTPVGLTIDAFEAQRLGCEQTSLDAATLHLSAAEQERFPRLGQSVEVSLFREVRS